MIKIKSNQLDMRKIADSGQIFRFNQTDEDTYELIAYGKILTITGNYDTGYELSCDRKTYNDVWKHFFDMETDYDSYSASIPKKDKFLTSAADYSRGVRILNQEPWEMLVSFIISQRKSIPAIKTSVEKICKKFGKKIQSGKNPKYAWPTPKELAKASMDDLLDCSLGYRAPYVYGVTRLVASGELDLNSLKKLDDEELMEELLKIKGVGIKVANCVMLFGYHRIAAFPIDVWIQKMIDEHYDGAFPLDKYKGYAGVIQQYIFFYGREMAMLKKSK